MIFSDGAGAVILQQLESSHSGILIPAHLAIACLDEINYINAGGSHYLIVIKPSAIPKMKGGKVYEYALKYMPATIKVY